MSHLHVIGVRIAKKKKFVHRFKSVEVDVAQKMVQAWPETDDNNIVHSDTFVKCFTRKRFCLVQRNGVRHLFSEMYDGKLWKKHHDVSLIVIHEINNGE